MWYVFAHTSEEKTLVFYDMTHSSRKEQVGGMQGGGGSTFSTGTILMKPIYHFFDMKFL